MAVLRLIRWPNLLIIAFCQILIKLALFDAFKVSQNLDLMQFALLVIATVAIAAGGNIINDIQDVAIDTINKPKKVLIGKSISEKWAYALYVIFTSLGVLSGFVLCNMVGKPNFAVLFVAIAALLYFYATSLKQIFIIGNLTIALVVAISVLIVPFFDFLPAADSALTVLQKQVFKLVFHYAIFAFVLTLLRELVKDILDVDGDHSNEVRSIPVVMGRERAGNLALALGVFIFAAVLYYCYVYFLREPVLLAYFFAAIAAPLLLFCLKVFKAESKKDYQFLSTLLKLIMALGIASMALYLFI
ncbi:MAG: geranylgeranylglycerol-phosphate geranylgeranyltransferase [Gilvibacter sp.]